LVLIQRTSGAQGLGQLAERLGVAKRLRFLPVVSSDDLVSLLQAARALLQRRSSKASASPRWRRWLAAARDWQRYARFGGVLGGAGLHAKVGDAAALGDALTRLQTAGVAEDLRQRGLDRAQQFSWQRTAAETLDVYREAAAAHAVGKSGEAGA